MPINGVAKMSKYYCLEQVKLIHDHTKHITTLASGSILVLVTFYEKLALRNHKFLLIFALVGFLLTIIFGSLGQIWIINHADENYGDKGKFLPFSFVLSWICFVVSLILTASYGIFNF